MESVHTRSRDNRAAAANSRLPRNHPRARTSHFYLLISNFPGFLLAADTHLRLAGVDFDVRITELFEHLFEGRGVEL